MDVEIIERKALTMLDLQGRIKNLQREGEDLNFRAKKVDEYIHDFLSNSKKKDLSKVREQLEHCGVDLLKERHIVKLLDMIPETSDDIKSVLSGEQLPLKTEDVKKIEDALNA